MRLIAHKTSAGLALGWFAGALLLLAGGVAFIEPVTFAGAHTYYVVIHRNWSLALPTAFGLFAALYLGVTLGLPIGLRPALGWAHLAVTAVGAALIQISQLALLCAGVAKRGEDLAGAVRLWDEVATFGVALVGLGLPIFVWALVDAIHHRKTR